MAGDIGSTVTEFTQKVVGGTLKAGALVATAGASITATGAAAAAGGITRAAGAGASRVGLTRTGSTLSNAGRSLQTRNFNFAQTRLGQAVSRRTGANLGAGMGNLSYSTTDTAVRAGVNNIRGRINNIATGRTPQSVTDWQDNVQQNRNALNDQRRANRRREAGQGAAGTEEVYDPILRTAVATATTDIQGRIEELQAELGRRSAADAGAERAGIRTLTQGINNRIQTGQNNINNLRQQRQAAVNSGLPTAAIDTDIQTQQGEIQSLEREIQMVERSSLDGRITQLQAQLRTAQDDAEAELLRTDREERFNGYGTQDSSLTIGRERRQARADTQAARAGRGEGGTNA